MQIGRRIFYNKEDGIVIVDTGERAGDVIETTVEEDREMFDILKEHNFIELSYGEYAEQFSTCYKYSINPETTEILFDFNFPPTPEPEPTELELLQNYALDLEYQLALRELENGGAE